MTAESGDDKLGDNSGDSIVTVTMEPDTENNQEDNDNAAEAQDYFKEGYSPELAQVTKGLICCLHLKLQQLYRLRPFWMKTQIFSRTTS